MKRVLLILVIVTSNLFANNKININNNYDCKFNFSNNSNSYTISYTDWDSLIDALIWVESRGITDARNPISSATGVLQQLNMYVKECNKIVGYNKYTKDDRLDPFKSIEMFNVMQDYYNPSKNIEKAIRLHSGGYNIKYFNLVYSKMNYFKTINSKII